MDKGTKRGEMIWGLEEEKNSTTLVQILDFVFTVSIQ